MGRPQPRGPKSPSVGPAPFRVLENKKKTLPKSKILRAPTPPPGFFPPPIRFPSNRPLFFVPPTSPRYPSTPKSDPFLHPPSQLRLLKSPGRSPIFGYNDPQRGAAPTSPTPCFGCSRSKTLGSFSTAKAPAPTKAVPGFLWKNEPSKPAGTGFGPPPTGFFFFCFFFTASPRGP